MTESENGERNGEREREREEEEDGKEGSSLYIFLSLQKVHSCCVWSTMIHIYYNDNYSCLLCHVHLTYKYLYWEICFFRPIKETDHPKKYCIIELPSY